MATPKKRKPRQSDPSRSDGKHAHHDQRTATPFLEPWYDPNIDPPQPFDEHAQYEYEQKHIKRLLALITTTYQIQDIPRRVNGPIEAQAQDKAICKKLRSRCYMTLDTWHVNRAETEQLLLDPDKNAVWPSDLPKQAPGELEWKITLESLIFWLNQELPQLAAVSYKIDEITPKGTPWSEKKATKKLARSYANRIINEIFSINQAYSKVTNQQLEYNPTICPYPPESKTKTRNLRKKTKN